MMIQLSNADTASPAVDCPCRPFDLAQTANGVALGSRVETSPVLWHDMYGNKKSPRAISEENVYDFVTP